MGYVIYFELRGGLTPDGRRKIEIFNCDLVTGA